MTKKENIMDKLPSELFEVPFPECSNCCQAVKYLGVSECDSICPFKFKENYKSKGENYGRKKNSFSN